MPIGIDSYTKLILHMNGVDGSTTFTDSEIIPKIVTTNGSAQIDTAQGKFGGVPPPSGLFDGIDSYLSLVDSDDWYFGTGNFTIDFWVRFSEIGKTQKFIAQSTSGDDYWSFKINESNQLSFDFTSEGVDLASYTYNWSLTIDTWYHLELTRNGINILLFIDGDLKTWSLIGIPIEDTEMPNFGGLLLIGCDASPDPKDFLDGWFDEFRISKGIARHTSSFTPPIEEYSQEVNTTFLTNFVSKLNVNKLIQTNLVTVFNRSLNTFLTNLTTKFNKTTIINTDLRTRSVEYTTIDPKPLTDIIVKKDGSELIDVDYSTLKIQFNLNRTPSTASFKLARHHDDLDHTLEGVDSEITDQNKIQIYDGTILLHTFYITQIKANSSDDTVDVVAEDIRCKINNTSMELSWGGKWDEDNNNMLTISTGVALASVMTEISSLITGYESIDFAYIPEYTTTVADCGSLIDNLVTNSANINWYVDENEYIRFTKVAQGIIKTLPLSSINSHRHIYDTILNDISINKMTSDYYPSLEVRLGKTHTMNWIQAGTNPTLGFAPKNYVKDLTWFGFQNSSLDGQRYVGEGIDSIDGYISSGFSVVAYFVYQWLAVDTYTDIGSIVVGSGEPQKTIFMSSYGRKIANNYWEERPDPTVNVGAVEQICLYNVEEENFDNTGFATDAANFELSQNNKLKSEANVTMILDAYEYYGINFKNLINLSNTLSAGIYTDSNGFPLNIDNISIDCATRIVSLSLTNYGKTYYIKTGNIMANYKPTSYYKLGNKQPIIEV